MYAFSNFNVFELFYRWKSYKDTTKILSSSYTYTRKQLSFPEENFVLPFQHPSLLKSEI